MAEKTFAASDVLTASDVNTYLNHTGGAWNSWAPTVTQSGSVSVTVNRAVYWKAGRAVKYHFKVTVTGSGTGSNAITVSLPVTAATSTGMLGSGIIFDSSTGFFYPLLAYQTSTTAQGFFGSATTGSASVILGSQVFTAGLAVSDTIEVVGSYESAS